MKTLALLALLFAACSPPPAPDGAMPPGPTPGQPVQAISRDLVLDGHLNVSLAINYAMNADNVIVNGYWSSPVPNSATVAYMNGVPGALSLQCPNVWAYVCSQFDPGCASPYFAGENIAATSRITRRGTLNNPFNGQAILEIASCGYSIGNVPITLGATGYNVYVGRSCTNFGGYTAGGVTGISSGHIDTPHISGGNYALNLTSGGFYSQKASWVSIGEGCKSGPHLPPAQQLFEPITFCTSVYPSSQICVGWGNGVIAW